MRPAEHPQQNRHRLISRCMRGHNDIRSALAGSIYQPGVPVVTGLLFIPAHPLSVTDFSRDTALFCHCNNIGGIGIRFSSAHPMVVMQHANRFWKVTCAADSANGKERGKAVRAT
jgi:hypothetical protein